MSYKNTEIEGDLAVGRHIVAGGNMNIRGNAKIGHNLKVEGYLEAPNIKDINKGVFVSYQELLTHYPTAKDGWLAGVVETITDATTQETKTQLTAYIGIGGQWVKQGFALSINMDVEQLKRQESNLYINVTDLLELDEAKTLAEILELIDGEMPSTVAALYMVPGVVLTFLGAEGWETWRWAGETYEDWIDETLWEDVDSKHLEAKVNEATLRLDNKIDLLAAGVKLTLGISPSIVYKGSATNVTLTGSINTDNPVTIALYDGTTKLGESSNNPYSLTQSLTQSVNSQKFHAEGTLNGMTLNAEVTLTARYPIYYGLAASKPTASTGLLKKAATTTAAGTYAATVPSGTNGVHLYILVPSDISSLSNFAMGGAPFVMNTYTNQTIDGVTYTIYESGNSYNAGTVLNVVAS